jgi:hypothetical protein
LDKKKLLPSIYEEWCATLLRHTSIQDEQEIINKFEQKFSILAEKLALDQGISYSHIETYRNQG